MLFYWAPLCFKNSLGVCAHTRVCDICTKVRLWRFRSQFSLALWVLALELRSLGFHCRNLYPLNHLLALGYFESICSLTYMQTRIYKNKITDFKCYHTKLNQVIIYSKGTVCW